ncbi:c-type cytochrome [Rhizobacter sp. AJA081-3]|uniref:c-type cytochrome n=1 Tax=Rhizobacter sp. AJA081-3 TaxID=2753607 RepID=UPI001ADFE0B8|nr:c-type cytochrome [Rhizobacter sp. AJA081-3]QTN23861.1 c-type cytochrome [Rhizobacter sp. AJA081-3]
MSSCRSLVAAVLFVAAGGALAQTAYPGIGRAATAPEVAAWDIDVRPDFKGLPKGKGSVSQGQDVWEAKCASCHGIFGESNSTFSPLVGGTTKDDVKSGRVARLTDPAYPGRTTLMKASTVSTLWDYINRAMPWTAPKSLSTDEVYAVTAFLLNLGGVLPDDFVLSDATMAQAQSLLPNRNGMTTDHAMWPGGKPRKPDVQGASCMKDCPVEAGHASLLPDHARNAHGNLAEQNRLVGAQHGADTTRPAGTAAPAAAPAPKPEPPVALALLNKNGCNACHTVDAKLVGPAFRDIAKKYAGQADAASYLGGKIRAGGSGVWGAIPMPAQTLSEADARAIAQWLAEGAKK